jgi:DNA-binding transcriptional LysR family regulator
MSYHAQARSAVVDASFTMLNALRALAQNQNVAQAADELHMTQSGLAQSIVALEKRLGTKLAQNTRHGLSLTKAGEAFNAEIRDPLDAFESACRSIFGFAATRYTVKVAFAIATERQIIEPLRRLSEAIGIDLSLRRMWTAEIPQAIESGEIDIGFMRHPRVWGDLRVETLWETPLRAMIPLTHRLARREALSLAELADETLTVLPRRLSPGTFDLIESACLRAGFVPKFAKMSGQPGIAGRYGLSDKNVGLGPVLSPDDVPVDYRQIPLTEPYAIEMHVITRYLDASQGPVSKVLAVARTIADDRARDLTGRTDAGT